MLQLEQGDHRTAHLRRAPRRWRWVLSNSGCPGLRGDEGGVRLAWPCNKRGALGGGGVRGHGVQCMTSLLLLLLWI